jgi:hypothetical protein
LPERRNLPELEAAAQRALPDVDATIDALDAESRELVAAEWTRRAASEISAGAVFSVVSRGLFHEGAPAELSWLASRAVLDEIRHAELCRAAAARYGAAAPPRPRPARIDEARGGPFMHAVANGAVNETIATAFLSAAAEAATSPFASAVVRELMTDEIDHARIGWALLSLPGDEAQQRKRDVERELGAIVGVVRDLWRRTADACPLEVPKGHGCLSRADLHTVVDQAVRDLVLVGFDHVGIDTTAARRSLGC